MLVSNIQVADDIEIIPTVDDLERFIAIILAGYENKNTKRTYTRALVDFFIWWRVSAPNTTMSKMLVNAHKEHMVSFGIGNHSINQRLTAIKRLAEELLDHNIIDMQTLAGIKRVKPIRIEGKPAGNWLTTKQAQELLDAPDITTSAGIRDRAILAVLIGCGLRRSEVASLTFAHIQEREGRWAIIDLIGKRNKVRTVLIASWVYKAVKVWFVSAALLSPTDKLFVRINKGDRMYPEKGIHSDSVGLIVEKYAKMIGVRISAHDLRRTFARLTYGEGADLSQIQMDMGHDNIKTTMDYIGAEREWHNAPSDRLKLKI